MEKNYLSELDDIFFTKKYDGLPNGDKLIIFVVKNSESLKDSSFDLQKALSYLKTHEITITQEEIEVAYIRLEELVNTLNSN